MPAWNTGTGAEEREDSPDILLRGYRAKWQKRSSASVSGCNSEASVGSRDGAYKMLQSATKLSTVIYKSQKDLCMWMTCQRTSYWQMLHCVAVIQSNCNSIMQDKISPTPIWEFSSFHGKRAVKVPKLQPSTRNMLQMHIQMDDNGSMSAKPVLKLDKQVSGMPVFLDVIKSHADVPQPMLRGRKR